MRVNEHMEHHYDRIRGWCEAHTPWSGHGECCPDPCERLLAEARGVHELAAAGKRAENVYIGPFINVVIPGELAGNPVTEQLAQEVQAQVETQVAELAMLREVEKAARKVYPTYGGIYSGLADALAALDRLRSGGSR